MIDKPISMKVFGLYECSDVVISDLGLKKYINIEPKLILKSHGRYVGKFSKQKVNIIERLISLIGVPGHRNKKQKIITSWASGKYNRNAKTVMSALAIIAQKTGKNPIQVVVKAVENSAPRDEITTIEYGGARYPQAVDCSPTRRINLALRNLVHGAQDKSFNKKTKIEDALASELIGASENNTSESSAVQKRSETEKMADSSR